MARVAPVVRLARHLISKFNLQPPVDVEAIARKYADLHYEQIPVEGVDGLCLYLKTPGKRSKIVINSDRPKVRQRFTLAHEVGHVLIPWHMGNIVDNLDADESGVSGDYWTIEQEANSFAAELLMPESFVVEAWHSERDLAHCHKVVADTCGVSLIAAAMRMMQVVEVDALFAIVKDETVEHAGRTPATLARALVRGRSLPAVPYPKDFAHSHVEYRSQTIHWWTPPPAVAISTNSTLTWRELLENILKDSGYSGTDASKAKSSINGVLAYAHGSAKQKGKATHGEIVAAFVQRLSTDPKWEFVLKHSSANDFLAKKADSFLSE